MKSTKSITGSDWLALTLAGSGGRRLESVEVMYPRL